MFRVTALNFLLAGALACGTPCSRIAAGEAAANDRGKACTTGTTTWDSARVQRCEAGLHSCSPDDIKWLDTYADCLQKLAVCTEGQSLSWGLSRAACSQSLFNVSGNCLSAVQ